MDRSGHLTAHGDSIWMATNCESGFTYELSQPVAETAFAST